MRTLFLSLPPLWRLLCVKWRFWRENKKARLHSRQPHSKWNKKRKTQTNKKQEAKEKVKKPRPEIGD